MHRREFVRASALTLAAPIMTSKTFSETQSPKVGKPSGLPFVHPGIYQTKRDLILLKEKVLAARQPWSGIWERLVAEPYSSLSFTPVPTAHIFRGTFGRAPVGDRELQASTKAAESHMLQWIVGGDRAHADKVIEILLAWSKTLWDFDGNDAMLLAGWTGATLCNTAEVLRSTYSGWNDTVANSFRGLMTDVYLPLLRGLFPTANGNWDAAIMQSLSAIAIYTDDRQLFDTATQHYLYGTGNAGITKYVYSNGQCEESCRDQGHSQLGLGYFSLMARIAWNQNVDLFRAADNRLALGFEYTAKYKLGSEVPYFGDISTRERGMFSDFYEAAYDHYRFVKRMKMPFTEQAVQKAREAGAMSALIFFRGETATNNADLLPAPALSDGMPSAGARVAATGHETPDAIRVTAGASIQDALDALSKKGGGGLVLEKGSHIVPSALRIPSNVTIAGQGRSTVLSLIPSGSGYCLIESEPSIRKVLLRDFILEGAVSFEVPTDLNQKRRERSTYLAPVRGGIRFQGNEVGEIKDIRMEHLTVRNCTMSGVRFAGASGIVIDSCDFSNNGGSVAPGPGQHHNLQLQHVSEVQIDGSRFDDSMAGCGLFVRSGSRISVRETETARNSQLGMRFIKCSAVDVKHCLLEGNDQEGLEINLQNAAEKLNGNLAQLNASDLRRNGSACNEYT
jgi:hypothetical protein